MQRNVTIQDLPRVERPREKLINYGPARLSNSELLAIILRTGKKGENVLTVAESILGRFGAKRLPNVTFAELSLSFTSIVETRRSKESSSRLAPSTQV